MLIGFDLKRIVAIGRVMPMPLGTQNDIEKGIEQPMKDKEHFNLLPEVNLLMPYQALLVLLNAANPDKDEK